MSDTILFFHQYTPTLKFVHVVDQISLSLSWSGFLSKWLSPEDEFWGVDLLQNVGLVLAGQHSVVSV
jgi:hypothetical protein